VKFPVNGIYSNKFNLIEIGCQLEILGRLKEYRNSNDRVERYVEGQR